MNRSRHFMFAALVGVLLALTGCTQDVERPMPTPTSSLATPTRTPTLTPTATPGVTPTPTHTPIVSATPTPIPTPVPQLFLDVQGPTDGSSVQSNAVVVHGVTTHGATVTINGEATAVDRDGRFLAEVTLSPGINTIKVVASDITGDRVTKALTITFQVPSPQAFFLLITEPKDQSIVSSSTIPLSGQTAQGAVVSVNGVGVAVDENGDFSIKLTLAPGPNIIDVVATYPDGRSLSAVIAVIFRP